MHPDALQHHRRFRITQKLTLMVNRYTVHTIGADEEPDQLVAVAQQKRMALKEQVSFYADEEKTQLLFGFKARKVMDLSSPYDVTDATGASIGFFRKDFGRSLLRSTWHLHQPEADTATGTERSLVVALLRRAWEVLPFIDYIPFLFWPYHFDFTTNGQHTMSVDKRFHLIKDSYDIEIHDENLDRRLAIAQAVALDALQSR